MKITDLNGAEIQIDDLQLALMQADDYRHFRHLNPGHRNLDEKLQRYWEDIYQQLVTLAEQGDSLS